MPESIQDRLDQWAAACRQDCPPLRDSSSFLGGVRARARPRSLPPVLVAMGGVAGIAMIVASVVLAAMLAEPIKSSRPRPRYAQHAPEYPEIRPTIAELSRLNLAEDPADGELVLPVASGSAPSEDEVLTPAAAWSADFTNDLLSGR